MTIQRKIYLQILAMALLVGFGCAAPGSEEPTAAESEAAPAPAEQIKAPVKEQVVKQNIELPQHAAPAADMALLLCELSGAVGTKVLCPVKVASGDSNNPATAFQLTFAFDDSKVALNKISCQSPEGADSCSAGALPTGHSLAWNPKTGSKNGKVSLIAFHPSAPNTGLNSAVVRDGNLEGDAVLFVAEFEIKVAIDASAPATVSMMKVMGADAKANKLGAILRDSVVVLSAP
jgi:hypothetical protein